MFDTARHSELVDAVFGLAPVIPVLAIDRIEADDFTGQVEAQHMLATFRIDDVGLDRAGANGSDGIKAIALAEYMVAFVQWTEVLDQHVQVAQ